MIRLRNCRRRKKQRAVIERLASKLWVPKLWLPMSPGFPCCCSETGCLACLGKDYPPNLDVTIGNVIDDQCTLCDGYNYTYELPQDTLCEEGHAYVCDANPYCVIYFDTFIGWTTGYYYDDPYTLVGVDCLGQTTLYFGVVISWNPDTGDRSIDVRLAENIQLTSLRMHFKKTEASQANPYDCVNFSSLNIPFVSINGACQGDGGDPTCIVTAA